MNRPPAGVIGIAVFFAFGAIMASLATLTLLMPASTLQNIWRLNPQARDGLLRMGPWGIGLMGVEHRVSSTLRFPLFMVVLPHAQHGRDVAGHVMPSMKWPHTYEYHSTDRRT